MIRKLIRVTILVSDQEEALRWYTEKLGFEKRADEKLGTNFRWLTVAPQGQKEPEIVLQKPDPEFHGPAEAQAMLGRIGQGTTWVLETDHCRRSYEELRTKGVKFTAPPEDQPWGTGALFHDLYGNPFYLLQPRGMK